MKKTSLLHPGISKIIAELGHYDEIVICDSGFPIPLGSERIDLALTYGVPGFMQTLEAVVQELHVQEIRVAEEMILQQPQLFENVCELFGSIPVSKSSHTQFKSHTHKTAKAFIRTGEYTPFANISLISGVVF